MDTLRRFEIKPISAIKFDHKLPDFYENRIFIYIRNGFETYLSILHILKDNNTHF